jgi:large conductance mechanosensitive channel
MKEIIGGFQAFAFRGNLIELAVAVVIGIAFGALVNAFVVDLLTPLIAAIFGQPSFGNLTFTINNATFFYGDFLNELITFLSVAAALYFLVVMPVNRITERMRRGEISPDPTTKSCPECLSDIPVAARRCAFCTVGLP